VALEKVNLRVPVWSPLIKEFRGRFRGGFENLTMIQKSGME
jgi:hypothetical protein